MKKTSTLPTLSVAVSAYNESAGIIPCLEALLAQGDNIAEIIVVDNNSTDDTVAKVLALHSPKIRVIHEPKQGTGPARNTGLSAASTDLIGRVDADTIIEPGWAQAIREFFANCSPKIGAASGPVWYNDLPWKDTLNKGSDIVLVAMNKLAAGQRSLYGCNAVVRREAWQAIVSEVCDDRTIMEDVDMTLHLRQAGYIIETIPGMRASTSGRRLLTSPPHLWRYNQMWARTFAAHHRYGSAATTYGMISLLSTVHLAAYPFLAMYSPATQKFSFDRLVKHGKTAKRQLP